MILANNTEDIFVSMIHPEIVTFAIYANFPKKLPKMIEVRQSDAINLVQLEITAFKEEWSLSSGLNGTSRQLKLCSYFRNCSKTVHKTPSSI